MAFKLDENFILGNWALRFDGYAYEKATNFKMVEGLRRYYETGEFVNTTSEKLAIFFFIQRAMRWSGDEPYYKDEQRLAYRTLFLDIYDAPVPIEYRTAYYPEWERDYLPNQEQCYQFIKRIHETTIYDINDSGRPS